MILILSANYEVVIIILDKLKDRFLSCITQFQTPPCRWKNSNCDLLIINISTNQINVILKTFMWFKATCDSKTVYSNYKHLAPIINLLWIKININSFACLTTCPIVFQESQGKHRYFFPLLYCLYSMELCEFHQIHVNLLYFIFIMHSNMCKQILKFLILFKWSWSEYHE